MTNREIYKFISDLGAKVQTDSRAVKKGDVYFSLKGDRFDGNTFARDALNKGATKAIIDDIKFQSKDTILVENVLETLQEIARIHRDSFDIPVLAITGTNGKTTTKELVSRVLDNNYKVHCTKGNLNNHIGLPLTILDAGQDTTFMVVEMGANHQGEITDLCEIAAPDAGLITNIGKAHLEGFGSYEGVIKAKSELYYYLAENKGTVIYNDSNPVLESLVNSMDVKSLPYSKPGEHLQVNKIEAYPELTIRFTYGGEERILRSELAGVHNAENIIAALAIGIKYGIGVDKIIESIGSYKPDNNRSQLLDTGKNLLLCDAYNANPDSMALALSSFLEAEKFPKTVVLGDMLELGAYSSDEHKRILEMLYGLEDLEVYLVGPVFAEVAEGSDIKAFDNTDLFIDYLKSNPIKDNFVFIKGSRGIGLENIYKHL